MHQRLDRYDLVAELASGGMATVFLGRIAGVGGFQRFVAIKRLHPHLAGDQEFVEMFLDEARLAASIHHPNVVPILEVGTSDRGYYLVMEYIEGDTLARLLARAATVRERIPLGVLIRILLDILAGLHAAHELKGDNEQYLNLVHRDVSPQNILVGIDGTARITDFGVARAATRLSTTRAGQLKGKLAYMAPEQARAGTIDRRADLFALGTVLWEVLADRRLFKGEGEADTLNRVLFEPIPRLLDTAPDTAPALASITMKALDRDPDNRQPNAATFADELEKAARSLSSIASHREVARYVQSMIGQEIAQQRDAVRAWLAQSEPSRTERGDPGVARAVSLSSSVSSAAISLPHLAPSQAHADLIIQITRARRRRRSMLWGGAISVGVVFATAFVWFSRRPSELFSATSVGSPLGTPAAAANPAASPVAVPSNSAAPAAVALPRSAVLVPGEHSPDSAKAVPIQQLPAVAPLSSVAPLQSAPRTSVPVRRSRPVPSSSPPPFSDDIPRNPYR
jgi:serine/threonine-protein kinase